ncbi:efflux RND transporter permease subunit [Phaeovulum sp. W22_SRMD_FR3]|uniref:efflux RND transporter permease subunit n=1 Tax=Phaeovulum sp. W22_SRMD_FR3 TaxID=3240274 RepID=UPI003F94628D
MAVPAEGRGVAMRARGILSIFARHRTLANIVLVLMIGAGLAALPRMRAQTFPDSVVQEVRVTVKWDGAGADDVDRAIVQVLEPSLLAVEGVDASSARATEGSARIVLEFEPGWDMARAVNDVETALSTSGDLPEEAETPEVTRGTWRDTVTDVVITGPLSPEQLGRLADELVVRLYAEGVTRTSVQGLAAPQTVVEVPSLNLIRHDVTLSQIAGLISAEAATQPAGDVAGGAARVRTGEEKRSAPDIASLVIRANPDGSNLTIGDVANIRTEGATRNRAYYVGPNPAMVINVGRSAQGDAIGIQNSVQKVVDTMALTLPKDTHIDLMNTRSAQITQRIDLLVTNGIQGLALVLGLLFLFLNARTALWVAAGIPVAMMAAVAVMYMAGLTFNMISIFALIITLGIVVDDAIVVGEHADFRARHLREPAVEAAENAAMRMAAPVFSSTATTVIAFAGLMVIGGRMGNIIGDIPFTVIAVLSASLMECFLILPNHMAHALAHIDKTPWYDWPSRQVNRGFDWFRMRIMRRITAGVVRARYPVLAAALALLAFQVTLILSGQVQWRFFNAPEQATVTGNFSMLPGATRADTMAMLTGMQKAVTDLGATYEAEFGTNPVKYTLAQIGGNAGSALASSDTKDEDQLGSVSIELIDPDFRPYSSAEFIAALQEATPKSPLLEELSFRGYRAGPGGAGISVDLSGAEASELKAAAEDLKGTLAAYPEVSALEDNLSYDKNELVLDLTPQGKALGFTIEELGRELRSRLNGTEAATFADGPRSASIRVELPDDELAADFIETMQLRAPSGAWVPLSDIVTVSTKSGFSTIRRENGLRLVAVTGELSEDDPDRANAITKELKEVILPRLAEDHGVAYQLAGLAEQENDFLSDALLGLAFCLIGIYIVLAWIFASWTRPLVVMSVIPFGLIGAIWGHYIWGLPMSMFSIVGLIGMAGIIINDSIVLVSTVDEYAEKRGLVPAIVDAVGDRLRPVLLTTLTTVLGLAPLLYEKSAAALFLKPTVITLCYGLGFGLLIVLLVVPALLAVQLDLGRHLRAFRRGLTGRHAGGRRARLALWGMAALMALAMAATLGLAGYEGQGMAKALGLFTLIALGLVGLAAVILPRFIAAPPAAGKA